MEMLNEYGLVGLFVASFLAATIIPFSSEAFLSFLIISGVNEFNVIAVASAGNWLGGLTTYYLGRLGKTEWLSRYFGVKREKVDKVSERINKYGSPVALFCWLPVIGDIFAAALGVFRVKAFPVAAYMLIGKSLRYYIIYMVISSVNVLNH